MSHRPTNSSADRHNLGRVHYHPASSVNVSEQALCFLMMLLGMLIIIVVVVVVLGQALLAASSTLMQSTLLVNALNIFKLAGHVFQRGAWPHWCSSRHKPLWRRLMDAFFIGLTWPYWYWKS